MHPINDNDYPFILPSALKLLRFGKGYTFEKKNQKHYWWSKFDFKLMKISAFDFSVHLRKIEYSIY
jgi:hypothetical protein